MNNNSALTKETQAKLIKGMKKIFPSDRLHTNKIERLCFGSDASKKFCMPECVAFPVSSHEVSEVMLLAGELGIPVVPRGAGSGTTGGAVPVCGGIVLVFTKMNKIREINKKSLTAVVEPGVVNFDLKEAVAAEGLYYPPDPASFKFSTIGGNLAECAGGPTAVKYGVTRDYVIGIEAVLPNGEIIKAGRKTLKGVVGYDLCALLVGSEGTLAIITSVTLRLLSLPRHKRTMLAVFKTRELAAGAVVEIIAKGVVPSSLELMDKKAIECVRSLFPIELPDVCESVLIIEVDGQEWSVDKELECIAELLSGLASGVTVAQSEEERTGIWKARRSLSPTMRTFGTLKLNEDIVVPLENIPVALEQIESVGEKYDVNIICFGHAGDGNIHVNIMADKDDEDMVSRAKDAVCEVFGITLELGGTISGEHGIGLAKAPYIGMELNPATLDIMRSIKDCFDPKHILNPDKIF